LPLHFSTFVIFSNEQFFLKRTLRFCRGDVKRKIGRTIKSPEFYLARSAPGGIDDWRADRAGPG
jgi:hypothetical protein